MTQRKKAVYIHTLDGQPASFDPAQNYLYFCNRFSPVKPAASLRQIRREQQAAIAEAWRNKQTREWTDTKRYGYVRAVLDV